MSTNINSTEQIVEINAGDQITNVNIVSQSTTQVISGEQVVTVDVNAGTIPAAWGSITGTLSNQTDLQNALNAKQNNITLTTTGTTGVATLVGATLNIPNYVSSTKQTEWDSAYNDKINSAEVSGTTTKTLTLTQQDGGIIQASWSDFDTAPVTSVFGRTGDVIATEGDYNINQLGDVTITSATNGQVLKYNGTAWVNAADASGLTSVGLAMPSAFTVSGSPLTSNGTITVTGAGTTSQYVRGDGSLAAFPSVSNEAKTLIREVYNKTGATLTKGTVIYIDGGQGNLPTVTKAIATGDPTSAQTFGIVQSDITNMNNGFVVVAGGIDNLDTQAYTEGTALYLSPTTAGAWTSTKPYAPDHMVYLGVVVRSHPTQGVIEVKIQNGVELDEIHDVSARFPVNKDGLFYNSTSGVWENKSIAGVLGYTPVPESRIITINGTAQNLSADRTWNVGTVTSVAASGGTGISVGGSPVTGSGTITITNTAPDQVVGLTGAGTTSISGTYPNFTITSNDQYTGTVTSVAASGGTGISISGSPITSSGTINITNTAPDQIVSLTGTGTTNITGTYPSFTINSADQYTGTVTSVAVSGGTGITISGSPVTGSGTINVVNSAPDQIVSLTGAGTTSISGTYPNFTVTSNDQYVGTVTSVNATVPTGFEVSGVPITSSGTVDIKFASGYSLPTNAKQTQWDDAYAKRIDSLTVTGNSGSATLTSNVLNVPTYTLTGLGGEPAITAGTTLQYWRGDKSFQTLDTSIVPENGNVYFTEPRVRATVLSGLNITGGSISASDSVLNAFGKVQNQINGLIGGSIFQSTWNASTNTPTLASGVGTKGYYYIVSVAGTTNLDGITDWQIGDWAIFDGTVWRKVDNTDAVVSVNGYTGVVSLVLDDLADVSAASPTNAQLLRFNGTSSKWENWTPNYLTTITLTGDVTGTGTSSIATTIGAGKVTNSMLAGSINYSKMDASTVPTWNQDTTGNAATADKWKTARTLTIGATGKSVDGSGNVTWSASDIGLTNYLPLAGGTMTGDIKISKSTISTLRVVGGSYDTSYNTSLRSDANAVGILQLGNNNDNYILAGNTNANGYLEFRVNCTTESITSGTKVLTLNANGTITASGSISGTSINLSSNLSAVGVSILNSSISIVPTTYGANGFISFKNIDNDAVRWNIYNYTNGGATYGSLNFSIGNGTDKFIISETGAATINGSLSVLTTGASTISIGNGSTTNDYGRINFYGKATGDQFSLLYIPVYNAQSGSNVLIGELEFAHEGSSADDKSFFRIKTHNGTSLINSLILSSTGAATFISSITASISSLGTAANNYLTSDSGTIKSRTAAQVLSDIGAASSTSLSNYLLLTGGTLTGALNGTSATFSSTLQSGTTTIIKGNTIGNGGAKLQLLGWFGSSKNWQIDTAFISSANELVFSPSTTDGGNTFTTAVVKFNSNGAGIFSSTLSAFNEIRISATSYPTSYQTSLRSTPASAEGILQLGNSGANYILIGNTAGGGFLDIRVACTSESITAGLHAVRINADTSISLYGALTGTSASFNQSVTINQTGASSLNLGAGDSTNDYGRINFYGKATGAGVSLAYMPVYNKQSGSNVLVGELEFAHEGTTADNKSYFSLKVHNGTSLINPFVISSTGLATLNNGMVVSSSSIALKVYNDMYVYNTVNYTSSLYVIQGRTRSDANSMYVERYNGTTYNGLTISGNGEALFNSTLQTGDDITIQKTASNLRLFIYNTTATTGRSWYLNSFSNGSLYIGNTTASDVFNFSPTGAATFSSTVSMASGSQVVGGGLLKLGIATGNAGAAIQLLGWSAASSYSNWQIDTAYINGNVLSFTPSSSAGGSTFTSSVFTLSPSGEASFSSNVYAIGTLRASSSGTAEVRLRGGNYGTSYNTSLRSIAGAVGVLQFGNNADNYILVGNTAANGYLDIRTNCSTESTSSGTHAMRITASQEVLINTTTDSGDYKLQVNGNVYATAYYESSDIRLKNIINKSYSETFNAIEFNWKDKRDNKNHWGYAAQDVSKYIPDVVQVNNDGYMTVNYNEAHTWKIAQLESEIKELKNKLNELGR